MRPRFPPRALHGWITALIVLAGCGDPNAGPEPSSVPFSEDLAALSQALGGARRTEPRLLALPVHRPAPTGTDFPVQRLGPGESELFDASRRALVAIRRRLAETPSAPSLHAAGVARLLLADGPGDLEVGRRQIQEAVALAGGGVLRADLAAAWLLEAKAGHLGSTVLAWETLGPVVEDAAAAPVVRFNRALIAEELGLASLATDLWAEAARHEIDPGWRREAENRRRGLRDSGARGRWRELSTPLRRVDVDPDPRDLAEVASALAQPVRQLVEQVVLPDWGSDGDPRRLDRAEALARGLSVAGGDDTLLGHVLALRATIREPALAQLSREAVSDFGAALAALYDDWDLDVAADRFRHARSALVRIASPYADWCDFYLALLTYYRNEPASALLELEGLLPAVADRAPILAARNLWIQGLCLTVLQRYEASVARYARSEELFTRAGELDNAAAVRTLQAESQDYLGNPGRAWDLAVSALRRLPEMIDPDRRFNVLTGAQIMARDQGFPATALAISEELRREVERTGDPAHTYDSALRRGGVLAELGRAEEALDAFRVAEEAADELSDPSVRDRARADTRLVQGRIAVRRDPGGALALLAEAETFYRETEHLLLLGDVLEARAEALRRLERLDEAAAELDRWIELIETSVAETHDPATRLVHAASARRAWDRRIELAVARERPDEAFRLLDEAVAEPAARSRDVDPVSAASEPAILALRRLPEGYLALWRDRGGIVWRLVADADAVDRDARTLAAALRSGSPGPAREAAERLYVALLTPFRSRLDGLERLVVVPDGALHSVPFAFLVDPERSRTLVEDVVVARALRPSDALAGFPGRQPPRATPRAGRALVLGDPALRPGSPDELVPPPLPAARDEARAIGALYPDSTLRLGTEADRGLFERRAADARVIHYAGHAVADPRRPLASRLLLAGTPDDALSAARILGGRPLAARLVVLSACSTAAFQPESPTSAVDHLAAAFLARGAGAVVATLWDLPSATGELFVDLHRFYRESGDPAAALRAAQLLHLDRDPTALPAVASVVVFIGSPSGRGVER